VQRGATLFMHAAYIYVCKYVCIVSHNPHAWCDLAAMCNGVRPYLCMLCTYMSVSMCALCPTTHPHGATWLQCATGCDPIYACYVYICLSVCVHCVPQPTRTVRLGCNVQRNATLFMHTVCIYVCEYVCIVSHNPPAWCDLAAMCNGVRPSLFFIRSTVRLPRPVSSSATTSTHPCAEFEFQNEV